jgi:aspartyl protease family protein
MRDAAGRSGLVGTLLLLPAVCLATDVRVVGVTPGRNADLVIDGGPAITLDVGQTVDGVRLLGADRSGAVVSVDGARKTLPLVAITGSAGSAADTGAVTLSADPRGQFFTSGTVNGRSVRFIVDTGATLTTLSRADARRVGLDYRRGIPAKTMTANGVAMGWRISLEEVSVGGVELHDVEAMVLDDDRLPVGLLGMSFLRRCDMHRQGSTLVLRRHR